MTRGLEIGRSIRFVPEDQPDPIPWKVMKNWRAGIYHRADDMHQMPGTTINEKLMQNRAVFSGAQIAQNKAVGKVAVG